MYIKCNPSDFTFLEGKFSRLRIEEENMSFFQKIEKDVNRITISKKVGLYELELQYFNYTQKTKKNLLFFVVQEGERKRVAEIKNNKLKVQRGYWLTELQDMIKLIKSFKNDIENWKYGKLRKRF